MERQGSPCVIFTIRTGLLHSGAWKEQKRKKIVPLQARAALLLEISQRTSPVFLLPKQKGLACCSIKGCKSLLLAQAVTRDKTALKLLSKQLRGKLVTCRFLHKYAAETPLKRMAQKLPSAEFCQFLHLTVLSTSRLWLAGRRLQIHCVTDLTQNNHRHKSFNVFLYNRNLPLNTAPYLLKSHLRLLFYKKVLQSVLHIKNLILKP